MLVKLPYGAAVDPEVVKYVHVRVDRPKGANGPLAFTVVLKTEEDQPIVIATFDEHAPAVALSTLCGRLINAADGEGEGASDAEDGDEDEADDDDEAPTSPGVAPAKRPPPPPPGPEDEDW